MIGLVGTIITPTRGGEGIGEVTLKVHGCQETYLALSKDPLPKGTKVLVIDYHSVRTVDVEPWDVQIAGIQ